ncbi:MAG: UDP-N-acetylmuramate dehydrogenase [Spirochaetales bacterium]|nr:UDP-N-acetylmuramate dehydrogenase [Spirochaetales bacterium]
MNNLRQFIEKINTRVKVKSDVSMKNLTSFKAGGNAEFYTKPKSLDQLEFILKEASNYGIKPFILGLGANILVADNGISGLTIDMKGLKKIKKSECQIVADAGVEINELSKFFMKKSLSNAEFMYGLPSTVGGAVWMNARCYDKSICDIIEWIEYIDSDLQIKRIRPNESFQYKKTPFQDNREQIIIRVGFNFFQGKKSEIKKAMNNFYNDRKSKGHFNFPSAGSTFKNNREFGAPTGKIIDELGLKDLAVGEAKIANYHGNIIINTGDASSQDIRTLIELVIKKVKDEKGFELEPEVLFVGDWEM